MNIISYIIMSFLRCLFFFLHIRQRLQQKIRGFFVFAMAETQTADAREVDPVRRSFRGHAEFKGSEDIVHFVWLKCVCA